MFRKSQLVQELYFFDVSQLHMMKISNKSVKQHFVVGF